jgi:uncharacterized protein (TIGR04255 family)
MLKRRYANPPVVEALCEVYFAATSWEPTVPGRFFERVRGRFPQLAQQGDVAVEIMAGPGPVSARMTPTEPRSRFSSADGSRMVQIGRDLLVVNQLRPYPRFEEWQPVVLEMAGLYREIALAPAIERIGVRYINRVNLQAERFRMERYFQVYPHVPEGLGASHGAFMMRLEIPPLHPEHSLLVTFGSAPPGKEGDLGLVLDLYDRVVPRREDSFADLARCLDEAHANIERAFEGMITDASRKLFEEITDAPRD